MPIDIIPSAFTDTGDVLFYPLEPHSIVDCLSTLHDLFSLILKTFYHIHNPLEPHLLSALSVDLAKSALINTVHGSSYTAESDLLLAFLLTLCDMLSWILRMFYHIHNPLEPHSLLSMSIDIVRSAFMDTENVLSNPKFFTTTLAVKLVSRHCMICFQWYWECFLSYPQSFRTTLAVSLSIDIVWSAVMDTENALSNPQSFRTTLAVSLSVDIVRSALIYTEMLFHIPDPYKHTHR